MNTLLVLLLSSTSLVLSLSLLLSLLLLFIFLLLDLQRYLSRPCLQTQFQNSPSLHSAIAVDDAHGVVVRVDDDVDDVGVLLWCCGVAVVVAAVAVATTAAVAVVVVASVTVVAVVVMADLAVVAVDAVYYNYIGSYDDDNHDDNRIFPHLLPAEKSKLCTGSLQYEFHAL